MFAFGWASFANLMAALKGKLGKVPRAHCSKTDSQHECNKNAKSCGI